MTRNLDNTYLSSSIGLLNPVDPILIESNSSLDEAIDLLKSSNGGAILVVDSDEKLMGIFTERDVLKKVVKNNLSYLQPLSQIMTKNPVSIQMTTPIGFALQLMSQGGFRHLPITDEAGVAIGMVSIKDIIDELVRKFIID